MGHRKNAGPFPEMGRLQTQPLALQMVKSFVINICLTNRLRSQRDNEHKNLEFKDKIKGKNTNVGVTSIWDDS